MLSFNMAAVNDSHYLAAPLAGPLAVVFYWIGLVLAVTRIRRKEYGLILCWFFTGIFLLSVINGYPPRYQHLVSVIPAMSILTALGLVTCVDFVTRALRSRSGATGALLTAAILGAVVFFNVRNYFVEMPEKYTPDAENIMDFAVLHMEKPRHIVYVNNDPSRQSFVPFMSRFLPSKSTFDTVSYPRLTAGGDYSINLDEDYTFFFSPDDKDTITAFLKGAFGAPSVSPQEYRNGHGEIILLSWSHAAVAHESTLKADLACARCR